MTLKTHLETGIALGLLISGTAIPRIDALNASNGSKLGIMVALAVGIIAGSIYPDIDLDESNLVETDNSIIEWEKHFGQRHVIHTLINAVGVCLPFLFMFWVLNKALPWDVRWIKVLGLAMGVGCVWHMVLDTFTPKGIMWLYPLTRIHIRIPIIRNYFVERLFRIVLTGTLLFGAVYYWAQYF